MCILCQQISPKCSFGNMIMTLNSDVTNNPYQIQITTICHLIKPPRKFSEYATCVSARSRHCLAGTSKAGMKYG